MRCVRSVCTLSLILLSACGGGGGGGGEGGATQPPNRSPTFATTSFSTPEDTQLTARVTAIDPDGDGASQAKLWLTAPAPAYFSVELDLDARGRPSKALSFRRTDQFDLPAGHDVSHSLQAAASFPFDATYAEVGRIFFPEGRQSEQGQGRFLAHQWFIDVAPAGSSVDLSQADTPRPSLTPDRPGSYLLRLEVFDGTTRSTDYLVVNSTPVGQVPDVSTPSPFARSVPGAVDVVDAGTEVTLDARKSSEYDSPTLPNYVWSIYAPDNSLIINRAPGATLRFTPTQPGRYQALFHRPDTTSLSLVTKSILVRPAVRYSPSASFTPTSSEHPFALDMDGDGRVDIVSPSAYDGAITLFRRLPNGRFADGVVIEPPGAGPAWFEDVTGDGRLDLIRQPSANTFTVGIQLNTGIFAAPLTLDNGARTCMLSFSWSVIGSVDIDRDGRNDLIRSIQCGDGNRWMLANRSPGGTFAAADELALPPGAWISNGAAGDVDNNGDRDLVGTPALSGALPTTLMSSGGPIP